MNKVDVQEVDVIEEEARDRMKFMQVSHCGDP